MSRESEIETVAAIAMHVARHKNFNKAYSAAADSMGGFPGLYKAAVQMAQVLEEYVEKVGVVWGIDGDWILTTEAVGSRLVEFMVEEGRLPDEGEIHDIVEDNIAR